MFGSEPRDFGAKVLLVYPKEAPWSEAAKIPSTGGVPGRRGGFSFPRFGKTVSNHWKQANDDLGGPLFKSLVDAEQKRDLSEASARAVLQKCLSHFKLGQEDLIRLPKSSPEKMLMAGLLRYHFPVGAEWVSCQLVMGHFSTVSRAMRFYDEADGEWKREKDRLQKFIG